MNQGWIYTTEEFAPGESHYDGLRAAGKDGWEAWHIEKKADGWREVYYKQPKIDAVPTAVSAEMVDAALKAWFASPPSETDVGLERSMRSAIDAALSLRR